MYIEQKTKSYSKIIFWQDERIEILHALSQNLELVTPRWHLFQKARPFQNCLFLSSFVKRSSFFRVVSFEYVDEHRLTVKRIWVSLRRIRMGSAGPIYRCQFHQHFYVRIFRTHSILAAFSSYVLALAKNLYEKYAPLTLMKLTAGVNFINIFFAFFVRKCFFWLEKTAKT